MARAPDDLTPLERALINAVRQTYDRKPLDRAVRVGQRYVGAAWINYFTRNLRHVHGLERLPTLDPSKSYLCVCNHRSFFDLYVVTGYLVGRGMPHRLMFPVRSGFWYDHPLGLVVNGLMSFFAMYPPIFRERQRAALNVKTLDEVTRVLRRGGFFVGLHPEGRRNVGGDPYELLPAQSGVGRVIHSARVEVLPVFINGLGNDLPAQIGGNITRKGPPIVAVFGAPIDFGEDLHRPSSPRLYRRIADRALAEVARLGQEERAIRATLAGGGGR